MDAWPALGQWAEKRQKAVIFTLLRAPAEQSGWVGQMAVLGGPEGEVWGPLTTAPFWDADLAAVLSDASAEDPPEGGRLAENSGRRYLISGISYARSALVLGGGHVGDAVCRLLRFLDFEVTLMDDRPEFLQARDDGAAVAEAPFSRLTELFADAAVDAAVIVTRGHAQDSACLRQVLSWPQMPPYVGMIGSRRRTRDTLAMLEGEGFSQERLALVHTPVGLDIGAQTPAEIAVAIVAEIIRDLQKPGNARNGR